MSKPVAVIRKVEDSPDWLDRRLAEAYLRTFYTVLFADFPPVRVGEVNRSFEAWLSEHHFKTCVFITAWNPASRMLSKTENLLRNNNLKTDLIKTSRQVLPALHLAGAGDWPPEESFWAGDISAENAILLGRKYGQNAIVWWEKDGMPELWWL